MMTRKGTMSASLDSACMGLHKKYCRSLSHVEISDASFSRLSVFLSQPGKGVGQADRFVLTGHRVWEGVYALSVVMRYLSCERGVARQEQAGRSSPSDRPAGYDG